jgi:hypothetical protein
LTTTEATSTSGLPIPVPIVPRLTLATDSQVSPPKKNRTKRKNPIFEIKQQNTVIIPPKSLVKYSSLELLLDMYLVVEEPKY